jgi:hypothetical protein
VEVALEPAPFGIARFDDPRARYAQVVELREDFGLQAIVLEREPKRGADLSLEVDDHRSVAHEGDSTAVPHKRGNRAPRRGLGFLDRSAAPVDVAS